MNINNKIFLVYIATLVKLRIILICQFYTVFITLLVGIEIFTKYSDFFNIFFLDSIVKLLKYTKINNYSINLLNNK